MFIAVEPLASTSLVQLTGRTTKMQWAYFLEASARQYAGAHRITLVMDNLNTHGPGSVYAVRGLIEAHKERAAAGEPDFVAIRLVPAGFFEDILRGNFGGLQKHGDGEIPRQVQRSGRGDEHPGAITRELQVILLN